MTTTNADITDKHLPSILATQLRQLADEAGQAGDLAMVELVQVALEDLDAGYHDSSTDEQIIAARQRCLDVLSEAEAQTR